MNTLTKGKRITAPWLPGVCIVQGVIPEEKQTMVVLAVESTGENIIRKVSKDQLARAKEVSYRDSSGHEKSGDPHLFRLAIEAMRLGFAHSYDPYFALSVSRVDPLPHQLEAVYMHMIKQPRIRFLLGDDAGAGKTIMAGLLLRELRLRGLIDRILIAGPANLSYQWRRELKDLFGEEFEIIKSRDVTDAYASNPWMKNDRCIVSRDWAKRPEVVESFEEADRWDLVIIDEAHGMATSDPVKNPSQRFKFAKMISNHTDHLLMMTATPHNGDKNRFLHFLSLLDDDVYSDPASLEMAIQNKQAPFYLRRLKESMRSFPTEEHPHGKPLFTKRTVSTVPFDIQGAEYKLYQDLTTYLRYIGQIARKYKGPRGYAIGFMMTLYQRRFASSPHALLRSLERRRDRLEGIIDGTWKPPKKKKSKIDKERVRELDDETLEKEYNDLEDQQFTEYDREQSREELEFLRPMIEKTERIVKTGTTAKWEKLKDMLDTGEAFDTETDKKLLIFTEHKDTLTWLEEKIQAEGYRTVLIHGGMKPGSRDEKGTRLWAETYFREEDGAQIMIATEAAGEGINLQFCWRMVNWDVPWNPSRLEQRIGRIHRYKQKRDVIAFNLIAVNTREGTVLEALQDKIDEIRKVLDPDDEGNIFDVVGSIIPPHMVEKMMKKVYEQEITKDEAAEIIRGEVTEQKFKDIIDHTLESLASKELNMGIIKKYNAEAKVRRLVPEVLRDFFTKSAELVFQQPVKRVKEDYKWKTPRPVMNMKKELRKLGDLGKEYKAFSFYKKDLDDRPYLEWVTPGHPLYEGVRRHTLKRGEKHLSAGARFYDPDGGPERWIQVFKYKMVDGNGVTVDEQLLLIEIKEDGTNEYSLTIRPPTIFLDLIPDDTISEPIPGLPERYLFGRVQQGADEYLGGPSGIGIKIGMERKDKAEIVRKHVEASLNALIQKEHKKFEKYEREQDKRLCMDRVRGYEDRLTKRELELEKQGEVAIEQNIPIALAYVSPLPNDFLQDGRIITDGTRHKLKRNDAVERAAVEFVCNWELEHGASRVESREMDGVGYDLESYDQEGNLIRFIEVKGKTTDDDGILTPNERSAAERLRDDYWLYIVKNPLNNPDLLRIQNPHEKLCLKPEVKIERYFFEMSEVKDRVAE